MANAKGEETFVAADTVIAAGPRKSNQELFREFEWMIDELHGCGDALMPRGLDAAIHEGYRLGVQDLRWTSRSPRSRTSLPGSG